jgi:hypothetical protein
VVVSFRCYHGPAPGRFRPDKRDRAFIDRETNMDVMGAAPLALGVLIALGSILVTMSYLSE